jgi:rare lipoprotein A
MARPPHRVFGAAHEFLRCIAAPAGVVSIGVIFALISSSDSIAQSVSRQPRVLDTQVGDATLYGPQFEGKKTASGRIFEGDKLLAAHRTYPFGTVVRVTCLLNKKSVTVVVVDRGPFGKNHREGAIIDLSPSAAKKLGIVKLGQARVKLEVLSWGKGGYLN